MPNVSFLDANVLIYAASGRTNEPQKWRIAHDLLENPDASVSPQVLAEFYSIVLKKKLLDADSALFWLERLMLMPCLTMDASLVLEGAAVGRRYQISYWDGAVLAAAERLGAETMYSEDLNHGQTYGSVRVVNPFLASD